MQTADRSSQWKNVWERKGQTTAQHLHHLNGYDLLSVEEWDEMVRKLAQPLDLRAGQRVIECGCGAGAFLASLLRLYPGISVSGMDYSKSLVKVATEVIGGRFDQGDIRDLGFRPPPPTITSCRLARSSISIRPTMPNARPRWPGPPPGGSMAIGEVSTSRKGRGARDPKQSHRNSRRSRKTTSITFICPSPVRAARAGTALDVTIVDHTARTCPRTRRRASYTRTSGRPRHEGHHSCGRLRQLDEPLTDTTHKTLLSVGGKTIIGRICDGLPPTGSSTS